VKVEPAVAVRVAVRFFASLRELTGESRVSLDLPEGSRAGDVWEECAARWPALRSRRASTVLAVNQEFARPDVALRDGDEVALLPPVSGGR
jgi:molybdopterin converting factor subunit 1